MQKTMTKTEFLRALRQHYTAPMHIMFKQFRDGAIYFTVGLMAVLMANAYMQPSVTQELVVAAGLLMGGFGFIMAMMAQVRMIIARLFSFFSKRR